MAFTPKTFVERGPGFKCVSPNAIQRGLDEAERSTNRTNFGVKADDAVFYRAAHIITLATHLEKAGPTGGLTGTPAGPIKSERLLEWSASYDSSRAFSKRSNSVAPFRYCFMSMTRVQRMPSVQAA